MVVADASALLDALVTETPDPALVKRLSEQRALCVPELIDVELLHGLRGMVRRGALPAERVPTARQELARLPLARFGHLPLLDRVWELRDNLTAYDATYVALAEALGLPLLTGDAGIARAPGHRASVELFEGGA